MDIIDRMRIPNKVFVSTVLAIFSRTRNIAASALGELQMSGVLRELFRTLGATDSMSDEYTAKVLRRQPPGPGRVISGSLQDFLDNPVDPGLIHKYGLTADSLVSTWNFDCLDDPSTMEPYSIGASVECEHHSKWKKDQEERKLAAAEPELDELDLEPEPEPEPPGELESLMQL